jgi:hypothetical protein
MEFFLMIVQPLIIHVLPTLYARANGSVHRVSSLYLFSAHRLFRCISWCTPSSPQILPARLMTNSPIMLAQVDVLVTIHIDLRRYFTQRFSPTGFIQNAPNSHATIATPYSRIQDKTCTFQFNPGIATRFSSIT